MCVAASPSAWRSVGFMVIAGPATAARAPANWCAVSPGASPFASCTADDIVLQEAVCTAVGAPCENYPNTEIEPWVDANPTNPRT